MCRNSSLLITGGVFAVFRENPEFRSAKRRFFAVSVHKLLQFGRRLDCNDVPDVTCIIPPDGIIPSYTVSNKATSIKIL